ncbi:hypothetical protein MGG_16338, partial [Pyricularia oryzae 70-15]
TSRQLSSSVKSAVRDRQGRKGNKIQKINKKEIDIFHHQYLSVKSHSIPSLTHSFTQELARSHTQISTT